MRSRVDSTRVIGQAILQARRPPPVWLQASTATIYEHRFDRANDEATGILGGSELNAPETWRFSIEVANAWENAAKEEAAANGSRLVLLRSAITMSPDRGGPFELLLNLVRFGRKEALKTSGAMRRMRSMAPPSKKAHETQDAV